MKFLDTKEKKTHKVTDASIFGRTIFVGSEEQCRKFKELENRNFLQVSPLTIEELKKVK